MGYYPVKLLPADKLFSNHIREKAGWKCQKCGKICKVNGVWVAKLEASHYFVRSHWSTRFDEENVYSLCFNCHKRMGEYKTSEDGEYDLWVKELLGEQGYKKLKLRANSYAKRDPQIALIYVKQLIKQK